MKYKWADPFILVAEDIAPWAPELIATSEDINNWTTAKVGKNKGSPVRDNDITLVSGQVDERWAASEKKIHAVAQRLCQEYFKKHGYLRLSRACGFDLLRYGPGQFYKPHTDNPLTMFRFIKRQLSMVLYLNDDFIGGELTFPNQSLYIKPKPGMAILFPSNFCYRHHAHEVREGTKYAVVTWIMTEPDDKPEEASKI